MQNRSSRGWRDKMSSGEIKMSSGEADKVSATVEEGRRSQVTVKEVVRVTGRRRGGLIIDVVKILAMMKVQAQRVGGVGVGVIVESKVTTSRWSWCCCQRKERSDQCHCRR